METVFTNLPTLVFILIAGLTLLKVTLFFTFKTKNWKLFNLLYFDATHITLTESTKRASVKRWQNNLTMLIAVLIIFEIWIKTLFK